MDRSVSILSFKNINQTVFIFSQDPCNVVALRSDQPGRIGGGVANATIGDLRVREI